MRNKEGQAVVEYLLNVVAIILFVFILKTGLSRSLFKVWETMTKEIAAGCVGCETEVKF
jgi:hypothetical protein